MEKSHPLVNLVVPVRSALKVGACRLVSTSFTSTSGWAELVLTLELSSCSVAWSPTKLLKTSVTEQPVRKKAVHRQQVAVRIIFLILILRYLFYSWVPRIRPREAASRLRFSPIRNNRMPSAHSTKYSMYRIILSNIQRGCHFISAAACQCSLITHP